MNNKTHLKILINCYACSPFRGSEPGMGWNFVSRLSQKYEIHIITEAKFKTDIDRYFLENSSKKERFKFYFIKRNRHKTIRKIWPPSYYWFYKQWQKKAYFKALELDKKENFDIIHQLNMIGYREPGYLWKIDKPFVWGPIGGFNITPWNMLSSMGLKGGIFYAFRNMINLWQMHCVKRIKHAALKSSAIISSTSKDQIKIKQLWDIEASVIQEVGLIDIENPIRIRERRETLKICWSGIHEPRKALNLLLEALANTKNKKSIELHVIGKGSRTNSWKLLAKKLDLNNVIWHNWMERDKAIDIMKESDLFCITSLSDANSTVLLETLSLGLPIISLDHCGFSDIINNDCGIKIPIESKKQVISDFSAAIDFLFENENKRMALANGATQRAYEFNWEEKIEKIGSIYESIITEKTNETLSI